MSRLFLVFGQVEYTKQPFKIYLCMHIGESKQKENHFFIVISKWKKKYFKIKAFSIRFTVHTEPKREWKKQMKQKKRTTDVIRVFYEFMRYGT